MLFFLLQVASFLPLLACCRGHRKTILAGSKLHTRVLLPHCGMMQEPCAGMQPSWQCCLNLLHDWSWMDSRMVTVQHIPGQISTYHTKADWLVRGNPGCAEVEGVAPEKSRGDVRGALTAGLGSSRATKQEQRTQNRKTSTRSRNSSRRMGHTSSSRSQGHSRTATALY